MTTTIRRWGNSQGLYIPKNMLKQIGVDVNDSVTLNIENSSLVIRKDTGSDIKAVALESLRSIRLLREGGDSAGTNDYRREYEEYLDERYGR